MSTVTRMSDIQKSQKNTLTVAEMLVHHYNTNSAHDRLSLSGRAEGETTLFTLAHFTSLCLLKVKV